MAAREKSQTINSLVRQEVKGVCIESKGKFKP